MFKHMIQKEPIPIYVKNEINLTVCATSKMTIFNTKKNIHLYTDTHQHTRYEFILAKTDVPNFQLDNTFLSISKDCVLAVDTNKFHGTSYIVEPVGFVSIQIEPLFLRDVMFDVFDSHEIILHNNPIPVDPSLWALIHHFVIEYQNEAPGCILVLDQLCNLMAITLLRLLTKRDNLVNSDLIRPAIHCMKKNLDQHLSLDALTEVCGLNKFHLIRLFKATMDMTPYDYFLELKILEAMKLLKDPHHKIIDVAILCGFSNHSHFTKVFKRKMGLSPSEYRAEFLNTQ